MFLKKISANYLLVIIFQSFLLSTFLDTYYSFDSKCLAAVCLGVFNLIQIRTIGNWKISKIENFDREFGFSHSKIFLEEKFIENKIASLGLV